MVGTAESTELWQSLLIENESFTIFHLQQESSLLFSSCSISSMLKRFSVHEPAQA